MRKGEPSRTARKVALNIIALGAVPEMEKVLPPGLVAATMKLLVAAGVLGPRLVRWTRSRAVAGIYQAFDWMLPGQFVAFAHRKAFCERQARESVAAGATQILVLGAGYDTLGWRLAPECPGVNFFEIDHPATAGPKALGVAAMGARDNLHLIAADLGERKLTDVLGAERAWNPAAKTVFIAEGLLMYLPPPAVGELLHLAAAVSGAGSRFVFTYIGTGADGRPDAGPWTGLFLWSLRVSGEPWLWSIRPEELGPFLRDHGWALFPNPGGAADKRGMEYLGMAERRGGGNDNKE